MANTFINPAWVLMETTLRLTNNLRFGNQVDRSYSDEYVQSGAKVGETVKARLPMRYKRVSGSAMVAQDLTDRTVDIRLTDQWHVGFDYQSWHATMNMDRYRERYVDPAGDELVNGFDFDGMQAMYQETANTVGTPGVVPGSTGTLPYAATQTYLDASERLHNIGVPEGDRRIVVSPAMQNRLLNGVITLFQPAQKLANQFNTGQFAGENLGWAKWFVAQNVALHTVGPLGGTPQIDGNVSNGATTILTKGWTAAAANRLKKGDVFQISSVYDINPMNRQALPYLKDFVVTADVDSTAGGAATIPFKAAGAAGEDAIYGPGHQFQTVSALPLDNANITIFGHASSYQNVQTRTALGFRKEAYAGVVADLIKPGGCWISERISSKALNISLRFVQQHEVRTDLNPGRIDTIYGWKAVRPDLAVRIQS